MAWTTPRTWVANETVTAALMNTHVRDNLSYLFSTLLPAGSLIMTGRASAPTGWLLCDGSVVSQATYADLYSAIGTAYNSGGEGAGNFRLPDFRGRGPLGAGTGTGLTARTLGASVGEESHILTEAELPAHTHTYSRVGGSGALYTAGTTGSEASQNSGSTGSGTAHNNVGPSVVVNYLIKT